MVQLNIFAHVRSNTPLKTIEFETIKEARDAMNELNCYDSPAEVYADRFVCRNFPNPYAIIGLNALNEVMDLYNARNDDWEKVYRPAF